LEVANSWYLLSVLSWGGANENFYVSILLFYRMLVFIRVIRVDVEHYIIIIIINSLQKTAILGTSHIIRKVLQCEA
jgi:hypothetical protein